MNLKYQFQIRRIINTLNKNELYNLLLENNIRLKKERCGGSMMWRELWRK